MEIRIVKHQETDVIRLTNSWGASVELCDFGARLIRCEVPDTENRIANVVAGYADADEYAHDTFYRGAIIGRFANRIANARFTLDGQTFHLDSNDGQNCNHGGFCGLDSRRWQYELVANGQGVVFRTFSPHGEGGFPGNLDITATYTWSDDYRLGLTLSGTTDRPTILNLTNHTYLNLSGGTQQTILRHTLRIPASVFTETDEAYIPTGRLLSVDDSPMDFRRPMPIGLHLPRPFGYNQCFAASEAIVTDPSSGRRLYLTTSLPGIMLYTAGYCPTPFESLSLEPQFWPDSPNHPNFPSCLIDERHPYQHTVIYDFCQTQ